MIPSPTEDWKARHKHECGKRLEVGESFVLASLLSRPELNGCRVVVERGMDEATRRVGVRVVAEEAGRGRGEEAVEGGGGGEEGGGAGDDADERKADGGSKASVVGLVISVKPMNLKKRG